MLHPTRQREGFAGRTSPGAAFAAAGTLVLHGPRSSVIAVVRFFVVVVCRLVYMVVLMFSAFFVGASFFVRSLSLLTLFFS